MASCAIRCGFFVLRDCGKAADQSCGTCGRPVCAQHRAPAASGGAAQCHDCAAKASDSAAPEDDASVYGYRRSFYGSAGYAPLYFGLGRDPYYDSFDVRAFDRGRGLGAGYGDGGDYDDADDGPASFADS